jgi:hypothetical protein
MKRFRVAVLAVGVLLSAPLLHAAGEPQSVGVGHWKADDHGSVETVTVGEKHVDKVRVEDGNIYLNGVLQKEKYTPGSRIELKDGKVVVTPPAAGPAK